MDAEAELHEFHAQRITRVIRISGHLEEIRFDGPRVDEYILVSLLVSGLREEKS